MTSGTSTVKTAAGVKSRPSFHPLELIPLFRRWQPSLLRNIIYTGLLNALAALFMTALLVAVIAGLMDEGVLAVFRNNIPDMLLGSNVVGYLIHGALAVGDRTLGGWPRRARGMARTLYYLAMVGSCVVLGIVLVRSWEIGINPLLLVQRRSELGPLLPFALCCAVFMFLVLMLGERRIAVETVAARQSEQIAAAAQLLAEARLRALQAQIEPHFLYNTLANVVGLIDSHPAQARRMLERFIDYLRASLAASRAEQASLGAELDLIAAYLDVLSVRMGARLRYRLDIGAGCREAAIAPMLLQPLVENAVIHGLEPQVDGGEIVVRARLQGGVLCLEVADTGAGFSAGPARPTGGVGLSNLRARLRSLHGDAAQLRLLENPGGGVTARVSLPLAACA